MSARKKSTSTDESSSGSSSGSTSSSGSSSGSESGSSSSDTESSSSLDEKQEKNVPKANDQNSSKGALDKIARRRSSELKQQQQLVKLDEKSLLTTGKNKPLITRGQRLSKSSICSSDEDISPKKLPSVSKNTSTVPDRKKITEPRKSISATSHSGGPPVGGGKAPPAVVKQQQQQNFAKTAANRQNLIKAQANKSQSKSTISAAQSKKKSIFSPDNSSDSDDLRDDRKPSVPSKAAILASAKGKQAQQPPKPKPKSSPQKRPAPVKKGESKSSVSSECSSSSAVSSTSSESEDSDSSEGNSSPPTKRPPPKKGHTKSSKTDLNKTVVLSDSDIENGKANSCGNTPGMTTLSTASANITAVRKLTRSSSTRKSKHLTGKASDSESEIDTDKRSISKSPAKKAPVGATKCKTKVKREIKPATPVPAAPSPVPEEQKCPVEGCDSTGHLSGNLDKHFLPEACPIFHNTTPAVCKERSHERRSREEERKKAISLYDPTKKIQTPEQKAYQMRIWESRNKFVKQPILSTTLSGEKIKIEKNSSDREPILTGLVPDYDLQLFKEAQAIASEKVEDEVKGLPVAKGIKYITMGKYQMKVWYQSPYPEDITRLPKMYICEFCLRYQKSEIGMKRHAIKCVWKHPPGDEIYRKSKLQVWQVDGKRHKQYCQHLCLLAKFFLDHKTLYYDVEPFLFYVMTMADSDGCHIVGYFSKEKNSFLNYNVSCILTLPPYQRKGYGRLLIDFSYLLTRVEGKIGSPEKPLSDLGLISYRSYWKDVLLNYLCTRTGTTLSIKDVSQEMAIYSYDIVSTLQALGMMKYWKGKHIVLKKQDVLEEYEERVKRRGNFPTIDRSCLRWSPFVPPQTTGTA